MRHVASGKRQLYYKIGILIYEKEQTFNAASSKFIMMIMLLRHKKNILSMYKFDMRHVAGGKRQVYYDVSILEKENNLKV